MTHYLRGFIPHARALLAFFAVFSALLLAAPAQAATIRVESGCTLAQAFSSAISNAAPSGSTCAAGDASGATAEDTIVLTADITVSAAVIECCWHGLRYNLRSITAVHSAAGQRPYHQHVPMAISTC